MKLSLNWLRDWVAFDESPADLATRLTLAGLEGEALPQGDVQLAGVVVGLITAAAPHPQADRLQVCTVDVGEPSPLTIVCGASNARVGIRVPCATVGAVLPNGTTITQANLRGVDSAGMLCSAEELGLVDKADGLLELDDSARLGMSVAEHLGLNDTVLVLELTPNRGDCLSVLGLAREVSALTDIPMRRPSLPPAVVVGDKVLKVEVTDGDACPLYAGRMIKRLKPGRRTPDWMRERLRRSGIRCIHPIVDITNFVMIELGQPMHAFDLAKLQGGVTVRRALTGESLTLLNDQVVNLAHQELVIADDSGPIALAGVMGGKASSVTRETETIFLESALFAPPAVAGTARRHKLHSDSSHRFERGVDPGLQRIALDRASQLIVQICGGEVHPITQAGRHQPELTGINLRQARVEQLLGITVPPKEVEALLGRLGMTLRHERGGSWQVKVPSHRTDLRLEVDLIEEIARLMGYDRIAAQPYAAALAPAALPERLQPLNRVRDVLVARGWQEVVTLAFTDAGTQTSLMPDAARVAVDNPIAETLGELRASLWPGLLQTYRLNLQRQALRQRLFEVGVCFTTTTEGYDEEEFIGGLLSGTAATEQWDQTDRAVDFFDLKADLEALFGPLAAQLTFVATAHPALHPGQSAQLLLGDRPVGWAGRIHPAQQQALDLADAVLMFEVSADAVRERGLPRAQTLSEYPSSRRDLALVVAEDLPVQQLVDCARAQTDIPLVDVKVFDLYRGESVGAGFKSVAIGLIFNDYSRTLKTEEIDQCVAALLEQWKVQCQASVRA
jgi:phenylalanyl-tRNA synthetase beta chain